MKIGIFDSGLGGLFVLKSLVEILEQYDYVYLGDTLRVPYGNKTQDEIYQLTKEGTDFLFNNDCALVIVACNSASAKSLRRIQQTHMPGRHPGKKILGVIIPTAEEAVDSAKGKIGVLATQATVDSSTFTEEIQKLNPSLDVYEQSAPQLVPIIESGELDKSDDILPEYLRPLLDRNVEAIVLGCTHYPLLKEKIQKYAGSNCKIIDQGDLLPAKLVGYLNNHPEIEQTLSRNKTRQFFATKATAQAVKLSKEWFGDDAKLVQVNI